MRRSLEWRILRVAQLGRGNWPQSNGIHFRAMLLPTIRGAVDLGIRKELGGVQTSPFTAPRSPRFGVEFPHSVFGLHGCRNGGPNWAQRARLALVRARLLRRAASSRTVPCRAFAWYQARHGTGDTRPTASVDLAASLAFAREREWDVSGAAFKPSVVSLHTAHGMGSSSNTSTDASKTTPTSVGGQVDQARVDVNVISPFISTSSRRS